MNPRIDKVIADIAKTKAKISEFQSKLRELERQKVRLENDHFVEIIRRENLSDAELSTLTDLLRKNHAEEKPPANNNMEDDDGYHEN